MLQSGLEHSPAHCVAKIDHAGGETFADLGEGLHEATRNFELASDEVDGGLVAQVAQLKGGVEATIDSGGADFRGVGFGEWLRAVCPVWWDVRKGFVRGDFGDALHSVD